jgi:26S proteasome regulatory subunit N5
MIKKRGYGRLLVISRKINPKNLEDTTIHDFKMIYYSYIVAYHVHEGNYLDVAKCYQRKLFKLVLSCRHSCLRRSSLDSI